MAANQPDFRHGRIIWAPLRTWSGPKVVHPAVILTPDRNIIQPGTNDPRLLIDNVVVVAGISTKYKNYLTPHVRLPFQASGHPVTGLTQDSAAMIGWYDAIFIEHDVDFLGGDVPPAEMIRINEMALKDIVPRIGKEAAAAISIFGELQKILLDELFPG